MICTLMTKVVGLAWSVISKACVQIEPEKFDKYLIKQDEYAVSDLGGQ